MYSREELKQLKQQFWSEFSDYCRTIPRLKRRTTMFTLYNTKLKCVEMKFVVEKSHIGVALEFNDSNPERRASRYDHFVAYRFAFNEAFGEYNMLIYQPEYILPTQKTVSRIYVEQTGISYLNRNNWQAIFHFLAHNMLHMEDAFRIIRPTLP